ncbi:hypothetical protein NMSP_0820 [Candidatus Nitrosomarinus catalina]|uniref:Uncharacterized protein n=1 Tax=Candidatus Nitrosomarinus catalinensis TaxID=1898749 RepID=A0A2Z2HTG0_9ARCH|nr:hypothetical protein [Candidatus Nitrosomarinus catalina]ARS64440.1 hypothetical protein NMSP_0820 [Candidatus Nitrosomarinus catalina]
MAEKKVVKKTTTKAKKTTTKAKKTTTKAKKTTTKAKKTASKKSKKIKDEPSGDSGIVIVDDDLVIDQEKINEERRAYLEEARSQEATD